MLARILFYPTLGINAIMTKVTSRNWYDRIDDTVILGALPLKSVTHQLIVQENVKAMVSVNEEYELRYLTYRQKKLSSLGIDQLHLSTTDLTGTPSQEHISQAVDFILLQRQRGNSVYVHCKAGRTRSATITLCYLMQLHKWNPQKAYDFVHERRPQIWLRKPQWRSIWCYYENHIKS